MAAKPISGWKLERAERAELLERLPPRFPDIVADHVTLRSGDPNPPEPVQAQIVGATDDEEGVQALVVQIDGDTARPDGGVFHITWSLDRAHGHRAIESNRVIAKRGWRPLPEPIPVTLRPEVWRG